MINNRATISTSYSKFIARELNLSEDALGPFLKGTNLKPREFMDPNTLLTPTQQLNIIENALEIVEMPGREPCCNVTSSSMSYIQGYQQAALTPKVPETSPECRLPSGIAFGSPVQIGMSQLLPFPLNTFVQFNPLTVH